MIFPGNRKLTYSNSGGPRGVDKVKNYFCQILEKFARICLGLPQTAPICHNLPRTRKKDLTPNRFATIIGAADQKNRRRTTTLAQGQSGVENPFEIKDLRAQIFGGLLQKVLDNPDGVWYNRRPPGM